MKPTVFIHTSSHEILSAKVAHFSHLLFSNSLDAFDIKVVRIEDYPEFIARHGSTVLRHGKEAAWYKDVPQSFLPLRFIVPQLMEFQGRALLTDPDIFATADVWELLSRDMGDKSVLSRRPGKGDGFNSSVMLLACEKLPHWKWNDMMEAVFQKRLDLQDLIRLRFEPEEAVGELEREWNDYDRLDKDTKLLHNTSQKTQPWKTGLPFKLENMNNFYKKKEKTSLEKLLEFRGKGTLKMLRAAKNIAVTGEPRVYRKHSDPNQEEFFLSLLKEALREKFVEKDFVKAEVRMGHIRRDIFQAIGRVNRSPVEIVESLKC
ncbi:MAG: hypothetical protein AAF716_16105 [Cyanobacteria bacterium P01_D01_bin.1]